MFSWLRKLFRKPMRDPVNERLIEALEHARAMSARRRLDIERDRRVERYRDECISWTPNRYDDNTARISDDSILIGPVVASFTYGGSDCGSYTDSGSSDSCGGD